MKPESIPAEHVETRILFVRAHKVLLDADLAALIWRIDQSACPSGSAKHRALSAGLHVSTDGTGA